MINLRALDIGILRADVEDGTVSETLSDHLDGGEMLFH